MCDVVDFQHPIDQPEGHRPQDGSKIMLYTFSKIWGFSPLSSSFRSQLENMVTLRHKTMNWNNFERLCLFKILVFKLWCQQRKKKNVQDRATKADSVENNCSKKGQKTHFCKRKYLFIVIN